MGLIEYWGLAGVDRCNSHIFLTSPLDDIRQIAKDMVSCIACEDFMPDARLFLPSVQLPCNVVIWLLKQLNVQHQESEISLPSARPGLQHHMRINLLACLLTLCFHIQKKHI